MTREQQIQNYAYNNCITEDVDDNSYSLIVDAIKWADETMIKKACKWLLCQEEMIGISFEDDFIECFKKAMEE